MNRDVTVCASLLLYFFFACSRRSRPPLARKTSSYFVCLCILLFIMIICWLAAGIWSSIAYECRPTITAVAIFSLMMEKRWRAAKQKRQFIMHRHNSPAHILGSQKLYATGGARKQGRNWKKSRGKGGGYSNNTYTVLQCRSQVYTLYFYYTLHTFRLLSRAGAVFTLLGRRFFQKRFNLWSVIARSLFLSPFHRYTLSEVLVGNHLRIILTYTHSTSISGHCYITGFSSSRTIIPFNTAL